MPSLHFGWALVIAWAVLIATKSRWRYLVLAHPVITLAAIVLTANHYWLDAVVATFLFALALGVDWFIERTRRHHLEVRVREEAETGELAAQNAASIPDSPSTYRPRAPHTPAGSAAGGCRQASSQR
jgi:hypothetical protein